MLHGLLIMVFLILHWRLSIHQFLPKRWLQPSLSQSQVSTKLPNVTQHAKKLKMSHFHSIAAEKQPTRAMQMPTVPEFSHIIVIGNLPAHLTFPISDAELHTCICLQLQQQSFYVPCKSKLLRQTSKKGGECRLFKFSLEQTPALQALADVDRTCKGNPCPPKSCGKLESPCEVSS